MKEATAAKRAGDLVAAIARIDEALGHARVGDRSIPTALKKRISYQLLAKRFDGAMSDALRLVDEAEEEAAGFDDMVGTMYSFAYGEKARVLLAMGRNEESFLERV